MHAALFHLWRSLLLKLELTHAVQMHKTCLVESDTLTKCCDPRKLSPQQRLGIAFVLYLLFVQ